MFWGFLWGSGASSDMQKWALVTFAGLLLSFLVLVGLHWCFSHVVSDHFFYGSSMQPGQSNKYRQRVSYKQMCGVECVNYPLPYNLSLQREGDAWAGGSRTCNCLTRTSPDVGRCQSWCIALCFVFSFHVFVYMFWSSHQVTRLTKNPGHSSSKSLFFFVVLRYIAASKSLCRWPNQASQKVFFFFF